MKRVYVLRALKIISLFLAVLTLISVSQNWVFKYRERDIRRMEGFRIEEDNSLDVVLIGSSDIYTGFSSAYAYGLQGFTSYPYTVASCPVTLWKTMLEETLRSQSPQLIVVDINGAGYIREKDLHNNAALHYVTDGMPLSILKIRTLREQCDNNTDSAWYYLFPFLKYHLLWQNMRDFEGNYYDTRMLRQNRCALLRGVSTTAVEAPPPDGIRNVSGDFSERELAEAAEQALVGFLEYCREKDLNVLFTLFPRQIGLSDNNAAYQFYQRANRAERIIRGYGFPFLNMARLTDKMNIDPDRDYYNENHLNIYGQRKATEFLARYLVEECGVIARPQSAENAAKWETSAEYYRLYSDYAEEAIRMKRPETIAETAALIAALDEIKTENPQKG